MSSKKGKMPSNVRIKNSFLADEGCEIKVGKLTAAAEEISGDAAISCGLPDGSLALILSDGMGKGIKAAAGSRLVIRRLRSNLKNGMSASAAIKEVNRYMIEAKKNREDFATVDLTLISKRNMRAVFYKMGAASSFILRNGKVKEIKLAALPVGMISPLVFSHKAVSLRKGDIIIMVSDGVTEADKSDLEAKWLSKELLRLAVQADKQTVVMPRKIAADIIGNAMLRCGKKERDDLTAAVAVIAGNTEKNREQ